MTAGPDAAARRESERTVLGAAISSARAAEEIAATLTPEHFAVPAHQIVFAAVMRLADGGEPVNPAAVLAELARTGMLSRVGAPDAGTGGAYLHTLLAATLARAEDLDAGLDKGTAWHVAKVHAAWQQDHAAAALRECLLLAESPGFDPDAHLDQIRKIIDDATAAPVTSGLRSQAEVINDAMSALEEAADPGLPTGFGDLDEAIGGLQPGKMVVIAARPGAGKSVLVLQIADHVAGRLGLPVLLASLEMREEDLAHRRIAAAARVPLHALAARRISEADWERIRCAYDRLTASELLIDDTPSASLAYLRGRLRGMARAGTPARLLVVDYLQLLAEPKADSRQAAVAAMARGCRQIAREFAIPVIVAAQLNRGPESRSDRRPVLSDLRESGEIEATADVVILLHREDAYEPESPRAGEVDLIIRKNRQGPQCTITVAFQGSYARMVSLAPGEWDRERVS